MTTYTRQDNPDGSILFAPVEALPVVSHSSGDIVRLDVPWIGQNTSLVTDDFSNNDCGPACVAMWLAFIGKPHTVDDISAATGLTRNYSYTLPGNLILAASKFGLALEQAFNFDLVSVKMELLNGLPCIALVHYGSLVSRYDQRYQAGHWLLITGYDDQFVYYHDPYWPDNRGANISIAHDQFIKAQADCYLDKNTAYQGLRLKR